MNLWKRLAELLRTKKKQAPIHIREDKPAPKWSDNEIVARENDLWEATLLEDGMGLPRDSEGHLVFPPLRSTDNLQKRISTPDIRRGIIPGSLSYEDRWIGGFGGPGSLYDDVWSNARQSVRNLNCVAVSLSDDPNVLIPCMLAGNHEGSHERADGFPWRAGAKPKPIIVHRAIPGEITGPEDLENIQRIFSDRRNQLNREEERTLATVKELLKEHFPEGK